MFVSIAVGYVVIFALLDLLFGKSLVWGELLVGGAVFGTVMTGIQYYKERNK